MFGEIKRRVWSHISIWCSNCWTDIKSFWISFSLFFLWPYSTQITNNIYTKSINSACSCECERLVAVFACCVRKSRVFNAYNFLHMYIITHCSAIKVQTHRCFINKYLVSVQRQSSSHLFRSWVFEWSLCENAVIIKITKEKKKWKLGNSWWCDDARLIGVTISVAFMNTKKK